LHVWNNSIGNELSTVVLKCRRYLWGRYSSASGHASAILSEKETAGSHTNGLRAQRKKCTTWFAES